MFGTKSGENGRGEPESVELLHELERSTPEAVKRQRAHDRVTVKAKVIVQPGNRSERESRMLRGVTGDVSGGGCQVLLPEPLAVGDIYLLTFEREVLDLGPTYARCLRVRMIREDAFEVGVKFFNEVDLASAVECGEGSAPTPIV